MFLRLARAAVIRHEGSRERQVGLVWQCEIVWKGQLLNCTDGVHATGSFGRKAGWAIFRLFRQLAVRLKYFGVTDSCFQKYARARILFLEPASQKPSSGCPALLPAAATPYAAVDVAHSLTAGSVGIGTDSPKVLSRIYRMAASFHPQAFKFSLIPLLKYYLE